MVKRHNPEEGTGKIRVQARPSQAPGVELWQLPVAQVVEDGCVHLPVEPLHRNVLWYRGGLVFKAHRRMYHSTLGLRVIKKKTRRPARRGRQSTPPGRAVSDGKGRWGLCWHSNSHGARPVHLIITMIKWIRTSRLSIKNSLSLDLAVAVDKELLLVARSLMVEVARNCFVVSLAHFELPLGTQHLRAEMRSGRFRGTSLIKKHPPRRTLQ